MNCNKCNRELPEDSLFCPYCAEPTGLGGTTPVPEEAASDEALTRVMLPEEMTEEVSCEEAATEQMYSEEAVSEEAVAQDVPVVVAKPKTKVWMVILAVVGALALVAVLAMAVLYGLGIDLRPRANDVLYKESYSVEDAEAVAQKDTVIAKVGDAELTNGELQVYYWETVYSFINNNYYYLSVYGLDTTKPLNEQTYFGDATKTWEQYFLETALGSWQRYTTLQMLARDDGFQPEEEIRSLLDTLPETVLNNATSAGFATVEEWLTENCGVGVSESGYMDYVRAYYESTSYLVSRYDELEPTDAEIEAYFTENEASFTANGVTKDGGKYYDVRHILVEIKGGTENEDGTVTYSDADWEACLAEAQKLLEEWQTGDGTEDGFATYAAMYSADGGSSTNGGLYSQLTAETNFVQEFKDWYLDESRQPGDTGLVKSTYGYHIMYFSASEDIWHNTAGEQLMADRVAALIEAGMETYPMETNYKKIVLGTKESL